MRSRSNGFFGAMFVFVPLITIPFLAVFGIPQFAPVVASPSPSEDDFPYAFRDQSSERTSKQSADDLFAPLDAEEYADKKVKSEQLPQGWGDPFEKSAPNRGAEVTPTHASRESRVASNEREKYWQIPEVAMAGWTTEQTSNTEPANERKEVPPSVDASSVRGIPARIIPESSQDASHVQLVSSETVGTGLNLNRETLGNRKEFSNSADVRPANAFARTEPRPRELDSSAQPFRRSQEANVPETPLTWGTAVEQLNSLGIRQFRLQPGQYPGEFHFTCFFTPRDNPRVTHRFEAEATEPLVAVQKVLDQINDWLERQ